MRADTIDVLIVGAGPAGLTLACELLRRGVRCRILDKIEAPRTTSRAIGLQARTLEVFTNMGIVKEALTQGIGGIKVNTYNGKKTVFKLDFRFMADSGIPYPYGVLLPQDRTEQILIDHLTKIGGQVERSYEVLDVCQNADSVIASVKHLLSGEQKEIEATWLVACDGAHSSIRKAMEIPFEGERYAQEFLLADVDLDWPLSHDEIHVWLHEDGQIAGMPLPDGHWRLMADLPSTPGHEAPPASIKLFQRLLSERANDTTTNIQRAYWLSNFQIHRRLAASYRKQRVFLAGDAAHIHSPFGGQGANTGIQDAFNLAWKLALVLHGKADERLLDSYEEERRPIARKVLEGTHQITSIFFRRDWFFRLMRDMLVVPLFRLPAVQKRVLWEASELGINYRPSPLSREQRKKSRPFSQIRKSLQAGDRAPECSLVQLPEQRETTLFQLFQKPAAHLLVLDGGIQTEENYTRLLSLAQHVKSAQGDEIEVHLIISKKQALDWNGSLLYDADHRMQKYYHVSKPTILLVRPDGYLGFCGYPEDEQALLEYLCPIFGIAQEEKQAIGDALIH